MLELDRTQLSGKIEAARAAIKQAPEVGVVEDRQFMTDALRNLHALARLEFTNASPTDRREQRRA